MHILPLKLRNPPQFLCPLQLLFLDRVHIGIFNIKSFQLDTVSYKLPGYKNTSVSIAESAEIVHFSKGLAWVVVIKRLKWGTYFSAYRYYPRGHGSGLSTPVRRPGFLFQYQILNCRQGRYRWPRAHGQYPSGQQLLFGCNYQKRTYKKSRKVGS